MGQQQATAFPTFYEFDYNGGICLKTLREAARFAATLKGCFAKTVTGFAQEPDGTKREMTDAEWAEYRALFDTYKEHS